VSDPTGTAGLRRSFLAEGNRRLARVRSLTHTMLVEHDLMAARGNPLAQLLPHPGNRLAAFMQWFEQTVNAQLLGGRWWERFLERAYASGFAVGSALTHTPPGAAPLPAVFRELAGREFAGIAAALVQQVTRQAAGAALGRRKPQPMYRQVLPVLRKVGDARVRSAANTLTVKLHNSGRLAQFRAAGITRVGIVPERLEPRKPSRFLKRDHLRHDHRMRDAETLEERKLRAANELLAAQQRQREAEQAVAQAELEAEQARVAAEIEAHKAGAMLSLSRAEAQSGLAISRARASEEVAAAKAATAAREKEAAAAWQEVLAARKEARAAEYAAQAAEQAVEQTAAEAATEEAAAAAAEEVGSIEAAAEAVAPEEEEEQVNVQTAGDDRVCDECNDIADAGPYTLDEADFLIPAHPNCRCSLVPVLVDPAQLSLLGFGAPVLGQDAALLPDYSPDQPRDPSGKWTGGGPAGGAEGGEKASGMSHEQVRATADKVSADLGFDSSRIDVVAGTRQFDVNGVMHVAAGDAEITKGEQGRIRLYAEHLQPESVAGVTAHEIEHEKFQGALDAYRRESDAISKDPGPAPDPDHPYWWGKRGGTDAMMKPDGSLREPYDKKYPDYTAMHDALYAHGTEEFHKGDGVSDYSAEYWKGYHEHNVSHNIAFHETLAEMARIKYTTGQFPEHLGYSRIISERLKTVAKTPEGYVAKAAGEAKGTTLWRNLYRTVDRISKKKIT
jgi:hypothetical protein